MSKPYTDDLAPVIAEALHLFQQVAGFRGLAGDSNYLRGLLVLGIEHKAGMGRLAKALRILVPPNKAPNPSKTSYGNARMAQETFRAMVGVLGMSQGG